MKTQPNILISRLYKNKIIVLYSNFETLEVKQENEEALTETLTIMTK